MSLAIKLNVTDHCFGPRILPERWPMQRTAGLHGREGIVKQWVSPRRHCRLVDRTGSIGFGKVRAPIAIFEHEASPCSKTAHEVRGPEQRIHCVKLLLRFVIGLTRGAPKKSEKGFLSSPERWRLGRTRARAGLSCPRIIRQIEIFFNTAHHKHSGVN